MSKSAERFDEAMLARPIGIKRVLQKDIQVEDEIAVEFTMRVSAITSGGDKSGQVFGFTPEGMCVSAPISSIVERFPRLGNGAEEVDSGEVFG